MHSFLIRVFSDYKQSLDNPELTKEAVVKRYLVDKKRLEKSLGDLRTLFRKQHRALQSLLRMKELAALELGVPQKRLCEHLLAYSPKMHRANFQKFIDNVEWMFSILEAWGDTSKGPLQDGQEGRRFVALLSQNVGICNQTYATIEAQQDLQNFRHLHTRIHRLAAENSTSSALKNYARAIRDVVEDWKVVDESRPMDKKGLDLEIQKQMAFVWLKQRAHPGFELHVLLRRACELAGAKELCSQLSTFEDIVQAYMKHRPRFSTSRHLDSAPLPKECRLADMAHLFGIHRQLSLYIDHCRSQTVENFINYYIEWSASSDETEGNSAKRFLITHGYSTTVSEVFASCVAEAVEQDDEPPHLFVMMSLDEDDLDDKIMRAEVRQKLSDHEIVNVSVGVGDEVLLMSLVEPEDRVMVVLGAECFDQEKRVVHPRGIEQRLKQLRDRAEQNKAVCTVVVTAEAYKYHKNLIDIHEFYRHHLDRISLYAPGLVDRVIGDDQVEELFRTKLTIA